MKLLLGLTSFPSDIFNGASHFNRAGLQIFQEILMKLEMIWKHFDVKSWRMTKHDSFH